MNKSDLKIWANVVQTLFKDILEEEDVVFRPAIVPFDSTIPGTVVAIIGRGDDGHSRDPEEIFSSCDFATMVHLVDVYQRRVRTYHVTRDWFSLLALNKASLNKAPRSYLESVA